MDDALDLAPLASRLPTDRPFTTAAARAAGVERAALERMLRVGSVRRLFRGVYAAAAAPDTALVRATAVRLACAREAVAVDRTAAWVHGVDPLAGSVPLDLVAPPGPGRRGGGSRQLAARDVEVLGGLCLTSPLRTALDVGRLARDDHALATMDALLAGGGFSHLELLAELPRMAGLPGVGQLRVLSAQVDERADGAAESVLRLRWHQARLPTAVPGQVVVVGERLVRLALAVGRCQFGAVLADRVTPPELDALTTVGWRVVVLPGERVLHSDPAPWMRHLEREFHQQLLAQTG